MGQSTLPKIISMEADILFIFFIVCTVGVHIMVKKQIAFILEDCNMIYDYWKSVLFFTENITKIMFT